MVERGPVVLFDPGSDDTLTRDVPDKSAVCELDPQPYGRTAFFGWGSLIVVVVWDGGQRKAC